ncbi:MAG TPA: hypothetical protein VMT52_08035, partial [Planctomycetota bacterium]|nr:hypothetical protein [Planctomycetota bacterium]
ATYKVSAEACTGKSQDFQSKVEFTTELGVPNSPPVDINLTVDGKALVPTKILGKQVEIQCQVNEGDGLALRFEDGIPDLVADRTSTLDVKVFLSNGDTEGSFGVQGWSYGITLDETELEVTRGAPGVDSMALNGGAGPDFVNYNLADQNRGGTLRGVTVGAVLDRDAPGTTVLAVGAGASRHIDSITVRSRQEIPAGGSPRTTELKFSSQLGGDRPLEILAVVGGESIVPDSSDTKTINLIPRGVIDGADRFIRGDANNDARVDIADGIWIINTLFYGGGATACAPAADANDDDRRDLTDAMYIFQYQLQPGRTPGNLFPAPPAPFPNCGSHPDATAENCPQGSSSC